MRRRHLLASLGAGVSLAGCLGSKSPGTRATDGTTAESTSETPPPTEKTTDPRETPPPTADPETLALGESFETPDGETVTVRDVRVQRAIFTVGVHVDPYAVAGEQFVLADATASDDDFRYLSVVADGRVVDTERQVALAPPPSDGTDTLRAVAVPAPLDVDRAAVVWDGPSGARGRWPLDDDHLHALANPPEFSVESFEISESVECGSSFTASLTVANSGSGDGIFRAELGATTISDTPELSVEVPAGESVTVERALEPYFPENADEITVRLNWSADAIERTVGVARQ